MKVIAFDVFGTVLNMDSIPRQDVADYVHAVKSDQWQPLKLPETWYNLKAHPDSSEGLKRLRQKFTVVAMSNGPVDLLVKVSKDNALEWDAIIPIQLAKVYKPNPLAYCVMFDLLKVDPSKCLMVTANPTFGDVEAAEQLTMIPQIIRHEGHPANIIELAQKLGA